MHGVRYRSDIDGLRAIAVVPVLLFHLNIAGFSGGFVGVDIFFVISGFLITAAIKKEIEAGEFTIAGFYERRIRRIFPALFAMMLAVLVAGYFILMPDELRDLGASMVGAALFVSNILFWRQTDYFAGPVDFKPLVHTWSLAVEEQYYIVFPIFLALLARFNRRRYTLATSILALLSFGLSVVGLKYFPSGNYYLLPTRAWELLVGSILAYGQIPLIRRRDLTEALAMAGVVLIAIGVFVLDKDSPFPGPNALWPCLGAAAILHAGSSHPTRTAAVLGSKPLVFLGLISYSLYLWHWPLIVFAKYQLLRDLTGWEALGLLGLTVLLATLSWRYVERPFRNRTRIGRRPLMAAGGAAIAASTLVGFALFATHGLPQRFGPQGVQVADRQPDEGQDQKLKCFFQKDFSQWAGNDCWLSRGGGERVLFWGDSHVNHYRGVLATAGLPSSVLVYASAGCLPILGFDIPKRPDCLKNNDHALEVIRKYRIQRVVLSGYWGYTLQNKAEGYRALEQTVGKLRSMGLEVKMIGDNPDYAFANPKFLGDRLRHRPSGANAPFYMATRNDWTVNPRLKAMVGDANFVDPLSLLCRNRKCLVYRDGRVVMRDNAHFSAYGSQMVAPTVAGLFR